MAMAQFCELARCGRGFRGAWCCGGVRRVFHRRGLGHDGAVCNDGPACNECTERNVRHYDGDLDAAGPRRGIICLTWDRGFVGER